MPLVFCFSTELLSSFTTKTSLNLAGLGSEVCCKVRATLLSLEMASYRNTPLWVDPELQKGGKKRTFWAKSVITLLTLTAQMYNKRQVFASMGLNTLDKPKIHAHKIQCCAKALDRFWRIPLNVDICINLQKYETYESTQTSAKALVLSGNHTQWKPGLKQMSLQVWGKCSVCWQKPSFCNILGYDWFISKWYKMY